MFWRVPLGSSQSLVGLFGANRLWKPNCEGLTPTRSLKCCRLIPHPVTWGQFKRLRLRPIRPSNYNRVQAERVEPLRPSELSVRI